MKTFVVLESGSGKFLALAKFPRTGFSSNKDDADVFVTRAEFRRIVRARFPSISTWEIIQND